MRKGIKAVFCHPFTILTLSFVIPYLVASFIAGMLVLAGDDHPWQGISTEEERREREHHFDQEADSVGHKTGITYGLSGLAVGVLMVGIRKALAERRTKKSRSTPDEAP